MKNTGRTHFNSETASKAGKKSKRKPLNEILFELAQELDDKKNKSKEELINLALLKRASKGDVKAIELYYKRTYGEIPHKLEAIIENKVDLSKLSKQELEQLTRITEKITT